jgi:hypothetical protein
VHDRINRRHFKLRRGSHSFHSFLQAREFRHYRLHFWFPPELAFQLLCFSADCIEVPFKINLLIGEIGYLIQSDIEIPYLKEIQFKSFKSRLLDAKIQIEFKQIKPLDKIVFADTTNLHLVKKSILFRNSWIANPIFYSSQFWEEFGKSSKDPNYIKIELAWNRVLFFDFLLNRFIYFFPSGSRNMFSGFEYQARVRNLVGLGLPGLKGMLVHGAGINMNDKGALFLAPDEGGKTSTVSLYKNDRILSDDQIVLRFQKNRTYIHGTPFGSLSSASKETELNGIFLIKKAHTFKITKASPNEVLKFIWDEHFFTICFLPKELKKKLFCSLSSMTNKTPSFHLHLAKGYVDWKEIESNLAG